MMERTNNAIYYFGAAVVGSVAVGVAIAAYQLPVYKVKLEEHAARLRQNVAEQTWWDKVKDYTRSVSTLRAQYGGQIGDKMREAFEKASETAPTVKLSLPTPHAFWKRLPAGVLAQVEQAAQQVNLTLSDAFDLFNGKAAPPDAKYPSMIFS